MNKLTVGQRVRYNYHSKQEPMYCYCEVERLMGNGGVVLKNGHTFNKKLEHYDLKDWGEVGQMVLCDGTPVKLELA